MRISNRHIKQKTWEHFTLTILCFILFITSSIAWYKKYQIDYYPHKANSEFKFMRELCEENEEFRLLYMIAITLAVHPLFALIEFWFGFQVAKQGFQALKKFTRRCLE